MPDGQHSSDAKWKQSPDSECLYSAAETKQSHCKPSSGQLSLKSKVPVEMTTECTIQCKPFLTTACTLLHL